MGACQLWGRRVSLTLVGNWPAAVGAVAFAIAIADVASSQEQQHPGDVLPEVTVEQPVQPQAEPKTRAPKAAATTRARSVTPRAVRRASAPPPLTPEELAAAAAAAAAAEESALLQTWVDTGNPKPNQIIANLPPPYAGGQVGVGTRVGMLGNESVFNAPFNVVGFTEKLNRDQQSRSVADVLINDPSVQYALPRAGPQDQFVIRGFRTFQQDILYDGLGGVVDTRRPAIDNIERVEVLKGPTAMLNGVTVNGNIGGLINFIPKRAGDAPLTRVTQGYVSDAEFGTYADVGRRFGSRKQWGVRVNGTYRDGDGALDDTSTEWGFASIALDYRSDRFRWTGDFGTQKQLARSFVSLQTVLPGFDVPRAPKGTLNPNAPWTFGDSTNTFGATRAELDVTKWLTVYGAYGKSFFTDLRFPNTVAILNERGDYRANVFYEPFEVDSSGYDVGARANFKTGPITHKAVFSAAGNQREIDYFDNGLVTTFLSNIYDPTFPTRPDTSRLKKNPGLSSFQNNYGYALADVMSLFNERIILTLGGRYQTIVSKSYDTTPGPTFGRLLPPVYDESEPTPAVGLVVKPLKKLSLYGNYIEGLQTGPTAPAEANNAGEVFPPFVQVQNEFGAKYDFGRFAFTASWFEITRVSAFLDPTTNVFGVDGEQVNRGLELNVFGEPMKGFRLLGGAAFIDAVLEKTAGGTFDGNIAPGVPDAQVSLYAEYDLPPVPGLVLTGRILYSDFQFYDRANLQTIPDWTRFDFGLRYAFDGFYGKPTVLRASIENIFGLDYYQSAIDGLLSRGAPRTFLVSAQMDF